MQIAAKSLLFTERDSSPANFAFECSARKSEEDSLNFESDIDPY
jgi:hypothetical protein